MKNLRKALEIFGTWERLKVLTPEITEAIKRNEMPEILGERSNDYNYILKLRDYVEKNEWALLNLDHYRSTGRFDADNDSTTESLVLVRAHELYAGRTIQSITYDGKPRQLINDMSFEEDNGLIKVAYKMGDLEMIQSSKNEPIAEALERNKHAGMLG
jgi:hypothetical protein